jgi:hypothetical protein
MLVKDPSGGIGASKLSRDISSGNLADLTSTALMTVTTRHHPSVYFGDRWQCCGERDVAATGCLQGDFVTSLSNFHHPGAFITVESGENFWDCCVKVEKNAPGCQTGVVMHHPNNWCSTVGGTDIWFCCKKKARFASGCTVGPHRNTYEEQRVLQEGTGLQVPGSPAGKK